MRAKSMVLILIALGCGLVASIAISQVMERGAKSGPATLETTQIYVATNDIDMNEQLNATNVRVEDWPKSKVPEGAIVDLEQIQDHFARVRFYEGEPILQAKLANEIDGPAIKIPAGYRVCSLKVQIDTAVSGLVNPGDRVDIIGYFRKSQDIPRTGTRAILHNVRIFAVNSETETEIDTEGTAIVAKTVSLLVEQSQVAKLMLATELGTLRLALRRPNETTELTEGASATIESLFGSRSEDADKEQTEQPGSSNSQLASAAGGFVNFLAGLKSDSDPAAQTVVTTPQPVGPAWEMVVLTPNGGTNFTWNDQNRLPEQGGAMATTTSFGPAPATMAPPVNRITGAIEGTPDAGTADPQDQAEEEEEEEDNQMMGDD